TIVPALPGRAALPYRECGVRSIAPALPGRAALPYRECGVRSIAPALPGRAALPYREGGVRSIHRESYSALLTRLVAARRFGIRLDLARMRVLLDRVGQPDRRLGTVFHVGGTNGKGSTVAMIAALAGSRG